MTDELPPDTTQLSVDPAKRAELETDLPKLQAMLPYLRAASITTGEQLKTFDAMGKTAKAEFARVDEERKKITGPIMAFKRLVDSWFKPTLDVYSEVEKTAKEKIADYLQATEDARAQAIATVASSYSSGQVQETREALAVVNQPITHLEGTHVRKVWKAILLNAGLVPYEFLSPDLAKVEAHTKGHQTTNSQDPPVVPGFKFELESTVYMKAEKSNV